MHKISYYFKRVIELKKRRILLKKLYRRLFYTIKKKNFKPFILKRKFENISFKFLIGNLEGLEWYVLNLESPEYYEMKFIAKKMINKNETIIEVGSHHGYTTIILSNLAKKGKVYAIEPFSENIKILKENVKINNLTNVEIIEKAIGSKKERIVVSGSDGISKTSHKRKEEVETIMLDSFEQINPTFIKIDVEGFEGEVLKGAKKILEKTPKVEIELHTEILKNFNTSIEEILHYFPKEKYETYIQWEDWLEPVEYDFKKPIKKRVHLFFIPKLKFSKE